MHSWWLFFTDHTCRRAWSGSSMPRRSWHVVQQGWRCWHSPFLSCTALAAAFPAWQSLDAKWLHVNIPPSLMGAQGLDSLWNKAWPSPLHGKHWHIQVILSTLFSRLRTGVLGNWRPAGTMSAVSPPQQLLVGPLQAGKLGLLRALSSCASHEGAVWGHSCFDMERSTDET